MASPSPLLAAWEMSYVLLVVMFGGVALPALLWLMIDSRLSDARGALEEWARQNGSKVIEARPRWLLRGPFFLADFPRRDSVVLRIKTQNDTGAILSGWAMLPGSYPKNELEVLF